MECVACGRKVSDLTRYCSECGAFQPEFKVEQGKKKKQNRWFRRLH